MTDSYTINVHCRTAWWLRPVIVALKAWVFITGCEPSNESIERIARRAVRTSIVTKRSGQ
ncbi:hypothetical protein [Burkholderia glumae]|uniref:hypothetical protein n=1 Tax=Burkholderia glumae TaxID=337 RepID=UPI0002F1640E|nr:hypothetical protein [Burkholderia glumae]